MRRAVPGSLNFDVSFLMELSHKFLAEPLCRLNRRNQRHPQAVVTTNNSAVELSQKRPLITAVTAAHVASRAVDLVPIRLIVGRAHDLDAERGQRQRIIFRL